MNRFHRRYCRSGRWAATLRESLLPWALRDAELGDHLLEVGPGPGLTTDVLRTMTGYLTAIEIDEDLASALERRMAGTNVTVVRGDATRTDFDDATFSSAASFTMLHYVPSAETQDRLLCEVFRVLRPGGTFVGADSRPSLTFRVAHWFDTMTLVDPDAFGERLERAGFVDVTVKAAARAFKFRGRKPAGE